VLCRDATASSFVAKIQGEVFAHRIHCVACKDEFFVNSSLNVKENYECALDFALHLSCLFSISVSSDFPYKAHAVLSERLSNHCQGLRRTLSEICAKFDAVALSDPLRNRIRPDTGLQIQIKGLKKSTRQPSCVKCCILTFKIC
jgi:hypothetical protein